MAFAELAAASNFSFLEGASHPDEMVTQAAALGLSALGVADRNTLAGVVRAHAAAKQHGVKLLVGARIAPTDGPEVVVYPQDRAAYGRLCTLLTLGKRRTGKGQCELKLADLEAHAEGLIALVAPGEAAAPDDSFEAHLRRLAASFGDRCYLLAPVRLDGADDVRLANLDALSGRIGTPLVATTEPLLHTRARKPLSDVLTCIRDGCTIDTAGRRLLANAERVLKTPEAMAQLFADYPQALQTPAEIAARVDFTLDELRYEYPEEAAGRSRPPQEELEFLTFEGAKGRYPGGLPARVRDTLRRELDLIRELDYAPYFLTVHDLVRFARSQGILCQGRGSAANSAVCYCLGITAVDPSKLDLLFERFVSAARDEPPDIDVDFEHERREEVIQYIYAKYGRDRAGPDGDRDLLPPRAAIREVGKAMGLSGDTITALAGGVWGGAHEGGEGSRVREGWARPGRPAPAGRRWR